MSAKVKAPKKDNLSLEFYTMPAGNTVLIFYRGKSMELTLDMDVTEAQALANVLGKKLKFES